MRHLGIQRPREPGCSSALFPQGQPGSAIWRQLSDRNALRPPRTQPSPRYLGRGGGGGGEDPGNHQTRWEAWKEHQRVLAWGHRPCHAPVLLPIRHVSSGRWPCLRAHFAFCKTYSLPCLMLMPHLTANAELGSGVGQSPGGAKLMPQDTDEE